VNNVVHAREGIENLRSQEAVCVGDQTEDQGIVSGLRKMTRRVVVSRACEGLLSRQWKEDYSVSG
jgi:hypothetical protein